MSRVHLTYLNENDEKTRILNMNNLQEAKELSKITGIQEVDWSDLHPLSTP